MKELYFGDCLDVLKELHSKYPDGFVDLIYIDPPFNSKRNYNVLFEDIDMTDTKAQREAFNDTWSNVKYKDTLFEIENLNLDLHDFLKTLDKINISKSSVAYLTTMAIRIYYMHKVLINTGSFYLHCDPNMSHYLKIICDLIFRKENFRNEITWQRTNAHNDARLKMPSVSDIIFYYTKSSKYFYRPISAPLSKDYIEKFYRKKNTKGNYMSGDLTGPKTSSGESGMEWHGFNPTDAGRSWAVPNRIVKKLVNEKKFNKMGVIDKLEILYKHGYIYFTKKGTPRIKRYLDDSQGTVIGDIWTDIKPISAHAAERLGYPTQKPEALLERIINASSKDGDVVADFFCGCGTTIAVANRLNRNWLGVDISHLTVKLILDRLIKPLPDYARKDFLKTISIHGFPKDIASAKALAQKDSKGRFEFQLWVVEFLLGGIINPKKTADKGWDGYITFPKNGKGRGRILIAVTNGHANVRNIREFITVLKKQEADMGVFTCFAEQVTKPMYEASKEEGYYEGYKFDKMQIMTIEDLLEGREIKIPGGVGSSLFKQAIKDVRPKKQNEKLF